MKSFRCVHEPSFHDLSHSRLTKKKIVYSSHMLSPTPTPHSTPPNIHVSFVSFLKIVLRTVTSILDLSALVATAKNIVGTTLGKGIHSSRFDILNSNRFVFFMTKQTTLVVCLVWSPWHASSKSKFHMTSRRWYTIALDSRDNKTHVVE